MPLDIPSLLLTPSTSSPIPDSMAPCIGSSESWETVALRTIFGIGSSIAIPRILQMARASHIPQNSQVLLALIPTGLFNLPNLRSLWQNRENVRAANGINDLCLANLLTQENFDQVIERLDNDPFLNQLSQLRDRGLLTQTSFERLTSLARHPQFLNALARLSENGLLTSNRFNSLATHAATPGFLEALLLLHQNGLLTSSHFDSLALLAPTPRFLNTILRFGELGLLTERNFGSLREYATTPRFLEATLLLDRNHLLTEKTFHTLVSQLSPNRDQAQRNLDHLTTVIGQLYSAAPTLLTEDLVSHLIDNLPHASRLLNGLIRLERSNLLSVPHLSLLTQHPRHGDDFAFILSGLYRQNLLDDSLPALIHHAGNGELVDALLLLQQTKLLTRDRFNDLIAHAANRPLLNALPLLHQNGLLTTDRFNVLIARAANRPLLNALPPLYQNGLLTTDRFDLLIAHGANGPLLNAVPLLHQNGLLTTGRFNALIAHQENPQFLDLVSFIAQARLLTRSIFDLLISHPHLDRLDFQRHLNQLSRVIDYLNTKAPGLLTESRLSCLIQQLRYAAHVFDGIKILHSADLARSPHLHLLLDNPEYGESLAFAMRLLHRERMLESELPNLVSHLRAVHQLRSAGLLNLHLPTLLRYRDRIEGLTDAICRLHGAGLSNSLLSPLLQNLQSAPQSAVASAPLEEELIRLLPHTERLRAGMVTLQANELLPSHLRILIEQPEFADELGKAISILKDDNLLNTHLKIICRNPQFAIGLASAMKTLNQFGLLKAYLKFLPIEHAERVANGIKIFHLRKGGLIKSELQTLIDHPEYAESLANGILYLHSKGLLETHKRFLLSAPQFASSLASAIVYLYTHHLLFDYQEVLFASPEYAQDLARGIKILADHHLLATHLDDLIQHREHAKPLARGMGILADRDLLPTHRDDLIQHRDHAEPLARGIAILASNEILEQNIALLLQHPDQAQTLAIIVSTNPRLLTNYMRIRTEYPKKRADLEEQIQLLYQNNHLSSEHLALLLQHPEIASNIAKLILGLESLEDLDLAIDLLTQNPQYASPLSRGILTLNQLNLLQSRLHLLSQHPAIAEDLANLISTLHDPQHPNGEMIDRAAALMIQNPQYSDSLRGGISMLQLSNLAFPKYLEILTYNLKEARSLAKLLRILQINKLLNRTTLFHLKKNASYVREIADAIQQLSILASMFPVNRLNEQLPFLFQHAPYASDFVRAYNILRQTRLDSLKNLEKIFDGTRAHSLSLVEYRRANPTTPLTQDLFDQIMARAPREYAISSVGLLSVWRPIDQRLPEDLLRNILSFAKEDPPENPND